MKGKNTSFLILWVAVFFIVAVLNYFVKQKALQDIREFRKVWEHPGRFGLSMLEDE